MSQMSSYMSRLKRAPASAAPKITTTTSSQNAQPCASVIATVFSSEDETQKGADGHARTVLRVRAIVTTTQAGQCFDCLPLGSSFGAFFTTSKTVNPRQEMIQMPRQHDGNTTLMLGCYINCILFKREGMDLSAASVPVGSRVKLSGIVCEASKKSGMGAFLNAKRADVLQASDFSEAISNIRLAMTRPAWKEMFAMEAVQCIGGYEVLQQRAPAVADALVGVATEMKTRIASEIESCVAKHAKTVVAEDKPYSTRLLGDSGASLKDAAAAILETARDAMPAEWLFRSGDEPMRLPVVISSRIPDSTKLPDEIKMLDVLEDEARVSAVPVVYEVACDKGLVNIFVSLMYCVPGSGAIKILVAGQDPVLQGETDARCKPCIGIKLSVKHLSVLFNTKNIFKSSFVAEELLPHASMAFVPKLFERTFEDTVFGSEFGGLHFPDHFQLDMPSTLACTGVLVSKAFVEENYATSGVIAPEDLEPANTVETCVKGQIPVAPILKKAGYSAITENTTVLATFNESSRLPPNKTHFEFRVVYKGCTDDISNAPSLLSDPDEAQKFILNKFATTEDLKSHLMTHTVVYAVAASVSESGKRSSDEPLAEPEGKQQKTSD